MVKFLLLLIMSLFLPLHASSYEKSSVPWGVDSELSHPKQEHKKVQQFSVPQKTCCTLIRFFQTYISPIDGPRSSYYPTSSQFALEAIQKYGVFKGIALGCDRLMRENGDLWVYKTTDRFGNERKLDPVR